MTFGHFWSLAKFSKINMGMRKNQHLRRFSLIIDGMKGTTITEKIIMEEKYNNVDSDFYASLCLSCI